MISDNALDEVFAYIGRQQEKIKALDEYIGELEHELDQSHEANQNGVQNACKTFDTMANVQHVQDSHIEQLEKDIKRYKDFISLYSMNDEFKTFIGKKDK